jgi:hypothetical protein
MAFMTVPLSAGALAQGWLLKDQLPPTQKGAKTTDRTAKPPTTNVTRNSTRQIRFLWPIRISNRASFHHRNHRQHPTGKWTSKLGELEDVEHTLDGLAGD